MNINLDVVVKSNEYEIDMQYGLDTLKGTSDVTSIIAESILKSKVPEKRTHKSDVRTKLKGTFSGSYGQRFQLEIKNKKLQSELRKIGNEVFIELIGYYISEAIFVDITDQLSHEASKLIEDLEHIYEPLMKRLYEPLKEMHKISVNFNQDVALNYKKRGVDKKEIVYLNSQTITQLTETTIQPQVESIKVIITRFNSMTGNGRFLIKATNNIVSFGFATDLVAVRQQLKKGITENLHQNNGVRIDGREYIIVNVRKMTLQNNRVIKYLVTGLS